ncbi:MAG: leucine-rich repeat protein [Bacteroidaceae bacterium]|nr:leucine-rich repeat protein [Bacteroidaceae bacterium]
MKKIYTQLLLLAFLCIGSSTVKAQAITVDNLTYTIDANGKALLSGVADATLTELNVPATITYNDGTEDKTAKVGGVAAEAFKNNTTLQKVTFAATDAADYLYFYASCFEGCANLTAIVLGSNTQRKVFYSRAFKNCTSLTQIGATANRVQLGSNLANQEEVFMGCTSITYLSYHFASTDIGVRWFKNCTSLVTINLANARNIGESAFEGCTAITTLNLLTYASTTVTLTFGKNAFKGCTGMTAAQLCQDKRPLTAIPVGMFSGCTKLQYMMNYAYNGTNYTATGTLPGITSIGDSAFYNCQSFRRTVISQSEEPENLLDLPEVTTIGAYAFYGCYQVTRVNLPVATTLGNFAFKCNFSNVLSGIKTVSGGTQLTSLGQYTFDNCQNLKTIGDTEGLVYLPKVTTLSYGVFRNCKAIEAIKMNQEGNYYSNYYSQALYGCSSLTKVTTKYVRKILASAFEGCELLVGVANTDDPTYVDLTYCEEVNENAFKNCAQLSLFTLPNTAPSLGDDAFANVKETAIFRYNYSDSYKKAGTYAGDANWKQIFDGTRSAYDLEVAVNKTNLYGTVSCAYPLHFKYTSAANLYKVSTTTDASATLEPVSSRKLPANTGAVLEMGANGESSTYSYTLVKVLFDNTESADDFAGNLLVANVDENTNFVGNEGNTWNLIMNDGKFVKANSGTLAAGLAYLPHTFTNGSEGKELSIAIGGATGINTLNNNANTHATWYTLNGVKLNGTPTQKGVYINNGKKVVIK